MHYQLKWGWNPYVHIEVRAFYGRHHILQDVFRFVVIVWVDQLGREWRMRNHLDELKILKQEGQNRMESEHTFATNLGWRYFGNSLG